MIGRHLIAIRRASSTSVDYQTKSWPYIDRSSLNKTLDDAVRSSSGSIYWINGGVGTGKTESIYRAFDRLSKGARDACVSGFVFDVGSVRSTGLIDETTLSRALVRSLSSQLARQLSPGALLDLLLANTQGFETSLRSLIDSKPLWAHYGKMSKTLPDLWNKVVTSPSVAAEILFSIRLAAEPRNEVGVYARLLKGLNGRVVIAFLHVERLESQVLKSSEALAPLLNPENNFNVLIECNDPMRAIWNVCDDSMSDVKIVEVSDFPKEAVKAVFVPSLLTDDVHVDALYSICGGRVALLEKIVPPLNLLNEEQRMEDIKQEQLYKTGREARPSNESKELQISPLVYKREVAMRDALVEGVLKPDVDQFQQDMDRMLKGFGPLVELEGTMTPMEIQVLVGESIRIIASRLRKSACMPLPSELSPLDIAHPVILGLLDVNILSIGWIPFPRIVAESPLKLFLLDSWYSAQLEAMSLHERAQYNLILMKNRVHLERQLEKLGQ